MIYEVTIYEVTTGEETREVELVRAGAGWRCKLDGKELPLDAVFPQPGLLSILVDGASLEVREEISAGQSVIVVGGERFTASVRDPRSYRSRRTREAGGQGVRKIVAPMPGKVVRVLAKVGAAVDAGQPVLVIEAMKMQNELKAPKKGKVSKLNVSEGAAVEAGQVLAEVE
ncbi:MAG TPA: biotin/lipoyl-containing protein [Candidatus Angelobacter sp.]